MRTRTSLAVALLGLALLVLPACAAAEAGNPAQRKLFLAAEKALDKGRKALYRQLLKGLEDYPLRPYLEYRELRARLKEADPDEVAEFLERNRQTPLARLLRIRWLNLLAARKDWKNYLRFYEPEKNVTRRCHHLTALLETGREKEALARVPELWLHGRSRPAACDPVFLAWRKAGGLTPALVWKRLELAMGLGQVKLARYLRGLLPKEERGLADLWIALRGDPDRALSDPRLKDDHPARPALLRYAAVRKARLAPLEAAGFWERLQRKYGLDEPAPAEMHRIASRKLVREKRPEAWRYYLSLDDRADDPVVQEQRILAALYRQQWEEALAWIEALPPRTREEERWRYWKARSLEQLGERGRAEPLFRELAAERSFYGFLAADHAGLPYNLSHAPVPVPDELVEAVARRPAARRARELVALGRWTDARREWRFLTRQLSQEEQQAAARLARSWAWHDQAIFTLARTGYWEDLELRFPLEHEETVESHAGERGLDVSWVFGVIRQESAFNPRVRSHAGALGLMQLMPATARYVARKLLGQKKAPGRRELTTPEINIRLGTTYLSDVLERLEQNPVLATAAYNAGPHRVTRWLPDQQLPADLWIELIPFRETRQYVKRVFTYAVIYDHRRKAEIVRLSERLRPIGGDGPQRTASQERNARATL